MNEEWSTDFVEDAGRFYPLDEENLIPKVTTSLVRTNTTHFYVPEYAGIPSMDESLPVRQWFGGVDLHPGQSPLSKEQDQLEAFCAPVLETASASRRLCDYATGPTVPSTEPCGSNTHKKSGKEMTEAVLMTALGC